MVAMTLRSEEPQSLHEVGMKNNLIYVSLNASDPK